MQTKKDRPPPDPFSIHEAEALIDDCDLSQGKLKVSKARVMKRDKDRTTGEGRLIELCPRALDILRRQFALRARLELAGRSRMTRVSKQNGHSVQTMLEAYARPGKV